MNRTVRFDATVDFETGELEHTLRCALLELTAPAGSVYGLHIPADGTDCEQGEISWGEHEFTREIHDADWVVMGRDAVELAAALRACLARG